MHVLLLKLVSVIDEICSIGHFLDITEITQFFLDYLPQHAMKQNCRQSYVQA